MIRINDRTVELSEAESVVDEWVSSIMDRGQSAQSAVDEIRSCAPEHGTTATVLKNTEFVAWLTQ